MFDYILKNGTIVDGSGDKPYTADLGIKDGKIAKIGSINADGRVIDCTGLIVTPGFIDNHNHSDTSVLLERDGYNYIEQGITTEVTGNCGESAAPDYGTLHDKYEREIGSEKFKNIRPCYASPKTFFDAVEKINMGTNMAFFLGQGNVRGAVMDFNPATPTKEQMSQMEAIVKEAMECGYLGITTGLGYTPSVYASIDEISRLAKVAAEYGGVYASHIRDEGNKVYEAVEEAIEVGRRAHIPVTVSHLKVTGKKNKGLSSKLLKLIEDANKEGISVHADQYPYIVSSAPLVAQLPPKFMTDGLDSLLTNLHNPDFIKTVTDEIFAAPDANENTIFAPTGIECLIAESKFTPDAVGKTLSRLAEEWGVDNVTAAAKLLIENKGVVQGIYFSQNDEDMLNIMSSPYVCMGTDWTDYPVHHDENQVAGGHPRGTSSALRRLELIRDNNIMPLEKAIYSQTYFAAKISGIDKQVGLIKEGRSADICLLNWDNIKTNSDFLHPFKRNQGLEYVFVNGALVLEKGVFNGKINGKLIRRDNI